MNRQRGFTLLEMLMVTALMSAMAAITLPAASVAVANYRFTEALNALSAEVAQARQTAMTQGCEAQVAISGASYQLNLEPAGATGFTLAAHSEAIPLASGISFGYGSLTVAAGDSGEQTGSQSGPAQATAISFNSLGLPVDATGNPTAQNAIYLTNGSVYGAITVSLAGRVQRWGWRGSSWVLE